MKHTAKRILSFFCVLCLLLADGGGILPQVLTAGAGAAYSATREVSASDGKTYAVTVTCDDDSIPADAVLRVTELTGAASADYVAESAELLGTAPELFGLARAFDISLRDPVTDEEYQPGGSVRVSFALLDTELDAEEAINVVHFGDAPEVLDSTLNGRAVEFDTESFSVYVITSGETSTPQCTFTFWVPNPDIPGAYMEYSFKDTEGNSVFKQTVTSGNELIVPQPVSTASKSFAGWYRGDMTGDGLTLDPDPYDFDNITITENSAIDLYAVYTNYAVVIFHDHYDSASGDFPIAYTRRAELVTTGEGDSAVTEATVKISDLSTTDIRSEGARMAFLGWSATPITTPGAEDDDEGNSVTAVPPDENGCITVTGDMHLYPIYIKTCLLTFYAAATGLGAAYNGPRYLKEGETLPSLPITSLNGYTFMGWFTGTMGEDGNVAYGKQISDANGNLLVGASDAGVYVSNGALHMRWDETLYAKWTPNTSADYKVLYWKQNGKGSDYIYAGEYVSHTGNVGATVSVSEADKEDDRYSGFHLKEEPASAEVKADGSTVLHVYYDHNNDYVPAEGTYTLTFADSVTGEGAISSVSEQVAYGEALKDYTIPAPTSGRKGYTFSKKWYLDPFCQKEAVLGSMTMPDQDLTLYAGWDLDWYVVNIDPNYGELTPLNDQGEPKGTGSTWFWQTVEREPIAEYTYVERNYVKSSSGSYYFAKHDRAYYGYSGNEWDNSEKIRDSYYTSDPSEATEDTTFEHAPGTYSYAGWYEILKNGEEVPYVFGERTDHDTNLILHWKKSGAYYLKYNAVVGDLTGALDDADASAELFEDGIFADYAEITLTRSAAAPAGYTFVGWQVRGSDSSAIYKPGGIFTLHADDATRVSGKDVVYLDAVYVKIGTAAVTYNANGGTVAENAENVDFGRVPVSSGDEWIPPSGTVDTAKGTATVSGLTNNSKFKLSGGTGFTAPEGAAAPEEAKAEFLGWSDKTLCDASATFYAKDSTVTYGVSGSTTLYAVWGYTVSYHLDKEGATWGGKWDSAVYTLDGNNVYTQTGYRNVPVVEPAYTPANDGSTFLYWMTADGEPYDFAQPVTGALELHACWGTWPVGVHVVDASTENLVEKTAADGWTLKIITAGAEPTALETEQHAAAFVTAPDGPEYAFAFAAVSNSYSVSEDARIVAVKYDSVRKAVCVRYDGSGENDYVPLTAGQEIYFVYYQKKSLAIGYEKMLSSGALEAVPDGVLNGAQPSSTIALGECDVANTLKTPIAWVGYNNPKYKYFAYAIGKSNAGNAGDLSLITSAVSHELDLPSLRIRNTWRGFEYTTETGNNAVWTNCGYDVQLYVLYFAMQPTVVMFSEETVGSSSIMDTEFIYNVTVTQTVGNEAPTTVFDTTSASVGQSYHKDPYILKNGEERSAILFYSSVDETVTTQTITITQTADAAFTTAINGTVQDAPYQYEVTSDDTGGTLNVKFTNTHKAIPVEVHVAMLEDDGILLRDACRNGNETAYRFELALGASAELPATLPAASLFTGNAEAYAFGAVITGAGAEEGAVVTVESMGVASIAYTQRSGNVYGLVLKDGSGNTVAELGSNQLYYLYYPMPQIRYVKETGGVLTDITGSHLNTETGNYEEDDSVTYNHEPLTMNGKTVEQNARVELPLSGLVISQSGNNFRMPPVLDDGVSERYLNYVRIGVGSDNAGNIDDLVGNSDGLSMQLKLEPSKLQYSFDGATWNDLPLSGTPTVYAIYSERGYDLQLSKAVDISQSGPNTIFSNASFTVTISSTAIRKGSYEAEGADSATVTATPATGTEPGTITLTVADGTKVRIKGLGRGEYTITESGNENYTLTAKIGPIVGGSASSTDVTDNTRVSLTLSSEKRVDLTNSPKAICQIGDQKFYTLQSMVDYVNDLATKTATAEMLTDYLMPVEDAVVIPNGCNITLTTIEDHPEVINHAAVITRTDALADKPLFTSNNGSLTLDNLVLEGNRIEASAPMIHSEGDLVIGGGATIRNAVAGGAICATAGDISVSGTITNCSAAEGGAIYHSGNGTLTLNKAGEISNNTATGNTEKDGNGGAIWLADGTVKVSGSFKVTGNTAAGNGGAVYSPGRVVVEIDQDGRITGNKAKEGGAIYAETGTILISKSEGVDAAPAVTGNTATTGNGGAIWVNDGSVSVSGGSLSNNKAENGLGGAVYAVSAPVTVSETAEVKSNTAKEGGAIYAGSGAVTVSGGTVGGESTGNKATDGRGGAIYAGSGAVTVSGGTVTYNTANAGSSDALYAGSGGAVYAGSGNVTVSGGSLSNNTAGTDGGAVCAVSGTITVSVPEGGTAPTIQGNTATAGNGGALCAYAGAVTIADTTFTGNTAGGSGGAVYANTGAVTVTGCIFGGDSESDGNTAGGNGGALYADSGNVTVSGGSMQNNRSTGGNGGAFYSGSGTVTVSNTTISNNSAAAGNGGAVYKDAGSLTLTTVTATGNSAINGAAVFSRIGRAAFSAGSYKDNVASNGGAVGVGSTDARLVFAGDIQIKDNKLGTEDDAPKSNVYLDQNDDAVINIDTLGSSASIGIYVADSVENTRGVPGARFAVYTSNSNVSKITNDRYPTLTVQSDTAAKKLYWGNSIKVNVHTLDSYDRDFTQPASTGAGPQLGKYDAYYPEFSDAALSELATELVIKNKLNIGTKVYAAAYLDGVRSFGDYITELTWDKEASEWYVKTRSGDTVYLKKTDGTGYHRIYIYYAEPAFLSIENNTDMALSISGMSVDGTSVINSNTEAGYGMVFAKNGAIRSALLPVTTEDLTLSAGQSINLLIPGGQNMSYTLDGRFEPTSGGSVQLRRGLENSLSNETVTVSATDGTFEQLTGTTRSDSKTYNIIFGTDKVVCKVVDVEGMEHPYSKISDALADIVATTGEHPPYTLAKAKTATIEMVTDYLLTASDDVNIPQGFDITLTTAAKTGATYCYNGTGDRATISRDTLNTDSMIKGWNALESNKVVTTLRLKSLIIDGKSVRGSSDGGAVATQYTNVYVDTVDFKNVYANNGGALLVMFHFDRRSDHTKDVKDILPNTFLEVKKSIFTGCTSTTTVTSNRLGGGAIVTNAETMTLEDCDFTNCTAVDQAGAVFHRVDKNNDSWTIITGCTFTNCSANAAGGLELDSKTITVENSTFEHCVATQRNGGGFNVWALNDKNGTPTADCYVTVRGCTFNDCQLTATDTSRGYGGGFRSNAVYNVVENCTFTNNSALYGGGFSLSNGNAKTCVINGCSFERNSANQGGGAYVKAKEFKVGDGYYYLDSNGKAVHVQLQDDGVTFKDLSENVTITDEGILDRIQTRHTEVKNCTSKNEGGGIYHDKNADNTSLTVTNATISGNYTTNSGKNGGGIFTNCRVVTINGSTITDNNCTSHGGGVYAYSYTSLTIADSVISRNTASGNGGGVWFDADNDTHRANQVLTIKGSTIDGNTSSGSNGGGGIYTLAKKVTIGASEPRPGSDGKAIRSSVSNNTAVKGGGIYHDRGVEGSTLAITDTSVTGNRATGNLGGGVRTNAYTLSVTNSDVSRNTVVGTTGGGGIYYDNDSNSGANRANMSLSILGSTIDRNTSGGSGGGIYTGVKTVTIGDSTDTAGNTIHSSLSNNTASNGNGGGLTQPYDLAGSEVTITGAVIRGNKASTTTTSNGHGGGVYTKARTVTVQGKTEFSGYTADKSRGGLCADSNNTDRAFIVDGSTFTGNTCGVKGGGIYCSAQLTLRGGATVTGNRLTTNTKYDAAGIYLLNGRTLYVGTEGAESDTVIVKENYTSSGASSNVHLWSNSEGSDSEENNRESVKVYCALSRDSEIRVVNAAKVGTQFGDTKTVKPDGFSEDFYVFKADGSTLHGIIDRTEESGKVIIWAGPPIAKITDGDGNLLYLKGDGTTGTDPAIFDRLYKGTTGIYNTVGAFNMLYTNEPELYNADGTRYEGTEFCVKMLVESFTTENAIRTMEITGKERKITFTTAGKDDEDYHYVGSGDRATVIRGSGVGNVSLFYLNTEVMLENIILDGGSENGITAGDTTRLLDINSKTKTVTLGENAILQNARMTLNGAGAFVNEGYFKVKGGTIRNCEAKYGGGIYIYNQNYSAELEAGSIYRCRATENGGGVYVKNGRFTMSGGTISYCGLDANNTAVTKNGGGVYVANDKQFHMKNGSIFNNGATTTGGGIAVGGSGSRLYFSGKVNVSGNTCNASVATNHACNVELNQNSKYVINTNNGGLFAGSYIGVYVPGDDSTNPYKDYGGEKDNFATFVTGDSTTTFYSFVNDRNGLKGGIIANASPNTIYWIQIFSLEVINEVVPSANAAVDLEELFLFRVNIRGDASVTGQLNAKQIDSDTGYYGEMVFHSNGIDTSTAVFALKPGDKITGINLSEGLEYEVIEYLTPDQAKRYAAMPMNGYNPAVGTLTYTYDDGTGPQEYQTQVITANSYSSKIGENKNRTDVDPYTSSLTFTNLMPVCKITDMSGNLLYRMYDWNKKTNHLDEQPDGGDSTAQPSYFAPAVFTELTGDDGAFTALDGLYTPDGSHYTTYGVTNGVKIQMLVKDYALSEAVEANRSTVILTTASAADARFPKQDEGTTSTIHRAFADGSMFDVSGDLTFATIILDGIKSNYTVDANGGIANVAGGGKLTVQSGATLQNSKTAVDRFGGAVYVAGGGTVTMTGGTVNHNESVGDGAGIYLATGSTLALSGSPNFGGTGLNTSGNITTTNGNFQTGEHTALRNGGKDYSRFRQDIFIAGYAGEDAPTLVVTDNIGSGKGSIWVWPEHEDHYKETMQFAMTGNESISGESLQVFRNARSDNDTTGAERTEALFGGRGTGNQIIWCGTGFDVVFYKVQPTTGTASGNEVYVPLSGAKFELRQNGQKQADATSDDDGLVEFRNVPAGTYTMVEVAPLPEGYAEANKNIVYTVTVEASNTGKNFTILRDGAAVHLSDDNYVIANISAFERRVILRKSDVSFNVKAGAKFDILRVDMTKVSTFTSGSGGVFFSGSLPYGTYYLHETELPSGVTPSSNDDGSWWYTLTVSKDGVTHTAQSATQPSPALPAPTI